MTITNIAVCGIGGQGVMTATEGEAKKNTTANVRRRGRRQAAPRRR